MLDFLLCVVCYRSIHNIVYLWSSVKMRRYLLPIFLLTGLLSVDAFVRSSTCPIGARRCHFSHSYKSKTKSKTKTITNIQSSSFTSPSFVTIKSHGISLQRSSLSDDDESSSTKRKQRKRRKRKTSPPDSDSSSASVTPRPDEPVKLQVQDIRDVVAGRTGGTTSTPVDTTTTSTQTAPTKSLSSASERTSTGDDSLERLLVDAREMQESDEKEGGLNSRDKAEEESFSIPATIGSVMSTIVTIDFFVVCALLLWFLTGIASSYLLKNDAIQIAFNNIFEPVVQPALGVLMIASIASSVFKEDEGEG